MNIEGIVLNSNKHSESTLVCNVLTEKGLFPFYIKGGTKPNYKNKLLILNLTYAEFEYKKYKDLNILVGGKVKISSSYMLDDFNLLIFNNFIEELFFKILTEEDYVKFYGPLKQGLKKLSEKSEPFYVYKVMAVLFDYVLKISGFDPYEYIKNDENNENLMQNYENIRKNIDLTESQYIEMLKKYNDFLFKLTNISLNSIILI